MGGHEGLSHHNSKEDVQFANSKLNFLKNPSRPLHHEHHEHHGHDEKKSESTTPDITRENTADFNEAEPRIKFATRGEASPFELFYDLWFVANLTVFATVHPITEYKSLTSFIGFFVLLWSNWYVTAVADARFSQDGVLNRVARSLHLGIMLGFAILGTSFQDEIVKPIIQITCFFLMVSRFVLASQYGAVLFHAHTYNKSRNALLVAMGIHIVPAFIYLAMGAATYHLKQKPPVTAWYVVSIIELIAVVVHSSFSKSIGVSGTHWNERLNLLTLIVTGEGVIILTKNVGKIVQYTFVKELSTSWSKELAGTVFCGGLILYMVFQLYFDYMHHHNHLPSPFQAGWTILHLPFHAVLVLLAEGSTQWAIWWRAREALDEASYKVSKAWAEFLPSENSTVIAESFYNATTKLAVKYGLDVNVDDNNWLSFGDARDRMMNIPSDFWATMQEGTPDYDEYELASSQFGLTLNNIIGAAFGLPKAGKKDKEKAWDVYSILDENVKATVETEVRRKLIFTYLFAAAGLVLVILMLMHFLSKRKGWTIFNIARNVFILLLGIGLTLISLVRLNEIKYNDWMLYATQLPIITLVYFAVLVITHIRHPRNLFGKRQIAEDTEGGHSHH